MSRFNEADYIAVKNAVKAIKKNQPKPEGFPEELWEILKKAHGEKSS